MAQAAERHDPHPELWYLLAQTEDGKEMDFGALEEVCHPILALARLLPFLAVGVNMCLRAGGLAAAAPVCRRNQNPATAGIRAQGCNWPTNGVRQPVLSLCRNRGKGAFAR